MEPKKKFAYFDVDGTIFRSSLLIEVVEELVTQGSFPESARDEFKNAELKWYDRRGTYETYIGAVVDTFMSHIKGLSTHDFDSATTAVMTKNHDRVYRYTRDLIAELKRDGYFLLAISHSPKLLLDKFCGEYGFDKVYGKRYIIDEAERFTGEIVDAPMYMNKGEVLKRAVEKEHLDLSDSFGVGDTEGDIPSLSLVSHPICFNPNATLYAHAKEKGWKVVVERKDVVYEL